MCYICTPKPDHLRIEKSQWYGQTIFTDKKLLKGQVIAMTIPDNYDHIDGYFKTPFGKVFNSTDNYRDVNSKVVIADGAIKIIASRDIEAGEEILLAYK